MQSSPEKSNWVDEISPRCPESVWRQRPVPTSQTLVVWSNEPVMILSPSELKLSETISAVWPTSEHSSIPRATSHSLAVLSIEPVATTTPAASDADNTRVHGA
eukprot:6172134-Pleurochrysis_carterae.AAC.1